MIEGVVIADLEKQLKDRENEILNYGDIDNNRVFQLEKEVFELKKIILSQKLQNDDKEEIEKARQALAAEKEELKTIQNMLKQDREKWNREMKEYKVNPTERKRFELYNIKKIIEKNIQKHNQRIRDLKEAEEIFKSNKVEEASEEEEIILEM